MSNNKNIGGRPGVIVLNVNGDSRKWSKSRKPVKVEIIALTVQGGEINLDGVTYRAETMPGFPANGEYKFAEVRGAEVAKYPKGHDPITGLNDEGMNPEDAAMYADIIEHARIEYRDRKDSSLMDCFVEFLHFHQRDPAKARKFYKTLVLDGWLSPDRDTMEHVKLERRRREKEMEPTAEEMREWEERMKIEMADMPPMPLTREEWAAIEAFEV